MTGRAINDQAVATGQFRGWRSEKPEPGRLVEFPEILGEVAFRKGADTIEQTLEATVHALPDEVVAHRYADVGAFAVIAEEAKFRAQLSKGFRNTELRVNAFLVVKVNCREIAGVDDTQ